MMSTAPDTSQAVKQILELEKILDRARVEGDAGAFDRTLSEDFITTSPVGALADKRALIADAKNRTMRVRVSRAEGISVNVIGEAAVVRGTVFLRATYRGHDISGTYAYTHVYTNTDGNWQVVSAHVSRRIPDSLFVLMNRFMNLFRIRRKDG